MADATRPRTKLDRLRDPIAALISGTVALALRLGAFDYFGQEAPEIAFEISAWCLLVLALVFTALGSVHDRAHAVAVRAEAQRAYRRGLSSVTPDPDGDLEAPRRSRSSAGVLGVILALLFVSPSTACVMGPDGRRTLHPGLAATMARVDVARVLECRHHLPDWSAVAKCVGAEAATQGLRIAYDRALEAIESMPNPRAGAELPPEEEAEAVAALETSLDALGVEIAETW